MGQVHQLASPHPLTAALAADVAAAMPPADRTGGLAAAFRALASVGREVMGVEEDALDDAIASALGWAIATGPQPLAPLSGEAARRIERFIKRALVAAEAAFAEAQFAREPS